MKAVCKREGLLEALDLTSPVKGKVNGLAARDGQVVVISGNETTAITAVVKAAIQSKGYALIGKEAVAFLKTLSGAQVTLSTGTRKVEVAVPRHYEGAKLVEAHKEMVDAGVLRIEGGGDSASFPFEDTKNVVGTLATEATIKKAPPITIKDLGHAIGSVLYAAKPKDPSWKSPMMGVGLVPSDKGFDLVASDDHRLAVSTIRTSGKVSPAVIDPAAAEILAHTDRVRMWQAKNVLAFQYGTVTLLTISQGEFPGYRHVIPAATKRAVKVYTDELREAVRKAATIVGPAGTVRLVSRGKRMKVIGMADGACAEPEVMSAGRIKQAYQASYLLDVLARVGEVLEIRLPVAADEGQAPPAVVRENGTTHLICSRIVGEWVQAAPAKAKKAAAPTPVDAEEPEDLDPGDGESADDELVGAGVD